MSFEALEPSLKRDPAFTDLIEAGREPSVTCKELIATQEKQSSIVTGLETPYSENWDHALSLFGDRSEEEKALVEKERGYFKEHLEGAPFVDVGGGFGRMFSFAVASGSSMYVNIDRWRFQSEESGPNPMVPFSIQRIGDDARSIVRVSVCADMLDVLSRMKDDSASFVINGIDFMMVKNEKYHEALAKEVYRATRPGGLIFGIESPVLDILLRQTKKGEIHVIEHRLPSELALHMGERIFQKSEAKTV
ncbi:MAG: hypothetical protein AAB473_04420 [Patescibacteria group bacterium]